MHYRVETKSDWIIKASTKISTILKCYFYALRRSGKIAPCRVVPRVKPKPTPSNQCPAQSGRFLQPLRSKTPWSSSSFWQSSIEDISSRYFGKHMMPPWGCTHSTISWLACIHSLSTLKLDTECFLKRSTRMFLALRSAWAFISSPT